MKFVCVVMLSIMMFASRAGFGQTWQDADQHKIHHVVIVWLKQVGDEGVRHKYIEESKPLAEIPGVLSYNIGTPASIKHQRPNSALDDSYDLAVSSTFENQQAFEDFLNNPEYIKLAQEVLRPLVEKYKVYDFAD